MQLGSRWLGIGLLTLGVLANTCFGNSLDLIAYWSFDNSSNLGADSGPNHYNLNASGTITSVAGESGGAALFDGSSDFLFSGVGFPGLLPTGNSAYSITAWVKTSSTGALGIIGWGNYGTSGQVNAFRLDSNGGVDNYWWGNDLLNDTTSVADSSWHFVAATWDPVNDARTIYIGGSGNSTIDHPGSDNAQALNFALGNTDSGEFFNGALDGVAVWGTALSTTQIDSLAAGASPVPAVPEPGSLALVGLGLLAVPALRRCASRSKANRTGE